VGLIPADCHKLDIYDVVTFTLYAKLAIETDIFYNSNGQSFSLTATKFLNVL